MKKYILKRFLQLIPVLLGITFLSFAMMRVAGSDAITELYGDKGAVAQEVIDAKRAELGLDQPFLTQYFAWLGGLLTGDMGVSYVSGRNVFGTFVSKLPATLLLTALSIVATVPISIPLGVLAAVQRFCAKREAMVEIAADGQIAESEQAEWDEIMRLANDLNVAMNNMRFSKGGRQS